MQQQVVTEFRDLIGDKTDIEHIVDDIMAVHGSKLEVSRPHAFKVRINLRSRSHSDTAYSSCSVTSYGW